MNRIKKWFRSIFQNWKKISPSALHFKAEDFEITDFDHRPFIYLQGDSEAKV